MEILKISLIGIVTAFCIIVLRDSKSEMAILIGIVGSIIILLMLLDYIVDIINFIKNVTDRVGIDSKLLGLVFKIMGIGLITEFSADIIEETGSKSLASKVVLGGKIIIFYVSLPVILSLFDLIAGLMS